MCFQYENDAWVYCFICINLIVRVVFYIEYIQSVQNNETPIYFLV